MTLESVIAKTMWMLGNFDLHSIDVEDIFYRSINYDVIFGFTKSVSTVNRVNKNTHTISDHF